MAITSKNPNMELFYVTRSYYIKDETYEVIMSLKELQSEIQRCNNILKIEKCILTKGEEVNIEDVKPVKYKGKPYTYREKYETKESYRGM